MNRVVGNGGAGDRSPRVAKAARRCVGREGFEGRNTPRGRGRNGPRKRGEPHGRKRAARCPRRVGGGSRRGGGKPRGRNESGSWLLSGRRSEERATAARSGSGLLHGRDDEGAIFGQTQERKWTAEVVHGRTGGIGKDGAKVGGSAWKDLRSSRHGRDGPRRWVDESERHRPRWGNGPAEDDTTITEGGGEGRRATTSLLATAGVSSEAPRAATVPQGAEVDPDEPANLAAGRTPRPRSPERRSR